MPLSTPHLSWIDDEIASLALHSSMGWMELVLAVEALSEANLSGRPINYLVELTGPVSFCDGPAAENLAEIFLQFIPGRTSIAMLRSDDLQTGHGEAEFVARLVMEGFRIGNFTSREAALAWLFMHPTLCAERDLHCGPDCPQAYSSTCPTIASQQSATRQRQAAGMPAGVEPSGQIGSTPS